LSVYDEPKDVRRDNNQRGDKVLERYFRLSFEDHVRNRHDFDKEVADDKKESIEKGLFTNRGEEKESVVDDA
jgi:hypothetical protein